ncbi:hypothetical protein KEM55_004796 [Ascosphaera atra]|nr:hypothetical protein KEM55_004796 [Ascosphaera atra]
MRHEGTRRGRAGSVSSNGTNGSAGTGGTNGAQIDWEGAHLYQRGSSAARSTLTGLSNTTDQGQSTEHIWAGHVNPVIGLQRRGLRGLAERRMRNPSALGGGMGQPGMVRNASSLSLAVPATASQQQAEHY